MNTNSPLAEYVAGGLTHRDPARSGAVYYHGSGVQLAVGARLRAERDGYVYLSRTRDWADAFAYRDAASRAVSGAMNTVLRQGPSSAAGLLNATVSHVAGYVYSCSTVGAVKQDPDFPAEQRSARTLAPTTVTAVTSGEVRSWRELTSITGPHQRWDTPADHVYDADGYLLPPRSWVQWGYTAADLQPLGKWFPNQGVWENAADQALFIVSEFSLPLIPHPARTQILDAISMRLPLKPATVKFAGCAWWP